MKYRCPREVSPFIPSIQACALSFMKYDPNYSYDDEDLHEMKNENNEDSDNDNNGDDNEDDEEEQEEDDDDCGFGSEDDDSCWKVRKAAVRVLSAVILARPELSVSLLTNCSNELISRFKEREESVRLDILICFSSLLQGATTSGSSRNVLQEHSKDSFQGKKIDKFNGAVVYLRSISVSIVHSALKLLKGREGTVKTKCGVFAMLKCLVIATQVRRRMFSILC